MIDLQKVDWYKVLPAFGIDAAFLKKKQGPCPICGGKDRFRFDNKFGAGNWFCNKCGAGNGLTLILALTTQDTREVIHSLETLTGIHPVRTITPKQTAQAAAEQSARAQRALNAAWDVALDVSPFDPVWTYLQTRVPHLLLDKLSKDVRYHPRLKYWDADRRSESYHPAMLWRVRLPNGRPASIHRTYLTRDGYKAPVVQPKKLMTGVEPITGGAIRLPAQPIGERMGVCEGIETALAVFAASQHQLPIWAAISATMLGAFVVPDSVRELLIYADHDPVDPVHGWRPGEHWAKILLDRLAKERPGLTVSIKLPTHESEDFADVWLRHCQRKLAA
jgi:putative DNA primase/helicase